MSKQKLKQLWLLEKKTCIKKVQKLKKKVRLKLGLNPQLSWLTTVCVRGFDRNVPQLFFVFSLHMLQSTVKNKLKQISISNHHNLVPRWRAFNFTQVPLWCVLGMPSNSAIKARLLKHVCKKYCFSRKKVFTSWIQTRDLLNTSQLLYPLSYVAVVFDGMLLNFSLLLWLQPATECKLITTLTRGDKLEGGWWVCDVKQLICRCRQSQACVTDRRTGFQLCT